MAHERVALCLVDAANDFQALLRNEAELEARRSQLRLEVYYTGHDLVAQIRQVRSLIAGEPPRAILVLAAFDHGLGLVAREAAQAGSSFVFLNRTEEDLDELRRAARPGCSVFTVCADEVETGRVQGRQLLRLLPRQGLVLYVQGSTRSVAARDRTAGVREATRGAPFDLDLIEAGWTRAEARAAAAKWFRIVSQGGLGVDLVSCQNDQIALGVLDGLQDVAAEIGRPELARIPVCGCDGTPQLGQTLVRDGRLRATVVLPRSSGPALGAVARLLHDGSLPPAISMLKATSFPAEATLQPLPAA